MVRKGAVLLGWMLGCGSSIPAPEVGTDEGGTGEDDRTDGLPPVERIAIPMRPQTEVQLLGLPELVEDDAGPRITLRERIDMAVGAGYPEVLELGLPEVWWATCGSGVGALELESITGEADTVQAELLDARTIRIEAPRSGSTTFVGRGSVELEEESCELSAGTELDLELTLSVVAHDATNARIRMPCPTDETPSLAPGAIPSGAGLSAELLDPQGEPYIAANADPTAQVDVELFGQFDAQHSAPSSLQYWIAPSRTGPVDIVPAVGEPHSIVVVDAQDIVAAPIEFQLAGTASGPVILVEGERYGDQGWGRAANRIAPMLNDTAQTKIGPLCSDPDPTWFRLESRTPSVCTVVDLPVYPDKGDGYTLYGSRLGQAARLEQAGTCTLELHAPGFASAAGFPRTLSAEFADPTGLHEF